MAALMIAADGCAPAPVSTGPRMRQCIAMYPHIDPAPEHYSDYVMTVIAAGRRARDYERTALAAEARREAATAAAPDEVHAMGESLQTSSTAILNRPPPTFSPPSPARPDSGAPYRDSDQILDRQPGSPFNHSTACPPP